MYNEGKKLGLMLAVSGIGLAWATAAFAQTATKDDDAVNGDIVVVGVTKQAQSLQKVPASITAFTGEGLVEQGIKEVRDIARFTPGFTIRQAGPNPGNLNLSMRGQVQNDPLATLEPAVGVYLDEFYVARAHGLNADLLDISTVQVLKGPQGTLFGRNTSAGALLLQTNDPKYDKVSGLVSGTAGNIGQARATTILNVGGENWAVRGAFGYSKFGDYQTDVNTGEEYGRSRSLNGRLKLAVRPAGNVEMILSAEWWDKKNNGPISQNQYYNLGGTDPGAADRARRGNDPDAVALTPRSQVVGAFPDLFSDVKTQTYIAKLKVDTGLGAIKWINGYRKVRADAFTDLDGSSPIIGNIFVQNRQRLKEWSSEIQLTGNTMEDALSYAAGLTYLREKGTDASRNSTNGTPNWNGNFGEIDNDSYGAYAQLRYKVSDAFALTGGLRYSIDKKGVTTQPAVFPGNGSTPSVCLPNPSQLSNGVPIISAADYANLFANQCRRGRKDKWNNFSYTLGVDYRLSKDILVYAKQSRGYRAGAEQLRTLTLTDTAPANPEIVNEQEIGVKSKFLNGRIRVNLAGYHNTVNNSQKTVSLAVRGISQSILENANTETWGAEADISLEVSRGFSLTASGALTDPKYTRYSGFVSDGQNLIPFDKSGFNFVTVPREQFSVAADYEHDLAFARLNVNVSYGWVGKMYQTDVPLARLVVPVAQGGYGINSVASAEALLRAATIPANGIVNARASLTFGPESNYEVSVWGRNILDNRAPIYANYLTGLNFVSIIRNQPATYGITATAKF